MNILNLDDVYDLFIDDRRDESTAPNYFFSLESYQFEETKKLIKKFKIGTAEKKWIFREVKFDEIEGALRQNNYIPFLCSSKEYKKCMWLFLEQQHNDELMSYFKSVDSEEFILQFVIRFDGHIGDVFESFARKYFFREVIKWCQKNDIKYCNPCIYK